MLQKCLHLIILVFLEEKIDESGPGKESTLIGSYVMMQEEENTRAGPHKFC